MDGGPIKAGQTVTISCSWIPGPREYGDLLVDGDSIFDNSQYRELVNLGGIVLLMKIEFEVQY